MVEHETIGEWKQFNFKMVTPSDIPKILTHLRSTFYKDEPLNKLCGFIETDYELLDTFVLDKLNQNDELSFLVEETNTGKVAGFQLTYKCASSKSSSQSTTQPDDAYYSANQKMQRFFGFFKVLAKQVPIFDKFGISYYADLDLTSVDPEFRRQGLCKEIYKRSLALLNEKGYPLCKSVFTSPYTRRVAEELGFKEVGRLYAADYLDEENGSKIFPTTTADHDTCGSVMVYKLLNYHS